MTWIPNQVGNDKLELNYKLLFLFVVCLSVVAGPVFAAGNITGYAWSNQIGWINFGASNGNATVTDSAITGYAWSDNYGWINLAPARGGVLNSSGTLSGNAWGENVGWINFSGITIDCSGNFNGTASGDVVGTVNFSCSHCDTKTTWQKSGCGGGGGTGTTPTPTTAPTPAPTPTPTPTPTPCPWTLSLLGLCEEPTPTPTPTPIPTPTQVPTPTPETSPTPTPIPGQSPTPLPPGPTVPPTNPPGPGGGTIETPAPSSTPTPTPTTIIQTIIDEPIKIVGKITETTKESARVAVKEVKKIVDAPAGSVATKTVTTTAVVTTVAASAVFSPLSLYELFLLPLRLLGLLLIVFGLKKRIRRWGVVYDSVTKQPLDPAYVILKNSMGKEISSAITDIDGRYGFLAGQGIYKMVANKTHYVFPSQKLAGRTQDEVYSSLYFGENIELAEGGGVVFRNIPMDPVKFDWNEFAKKDKKLMRFYSNFDAFLRGIADIFFAIGFFVALVVFFVAPYPYNTIIMVIYLVLLFLRFVGVKPKPYGNIIDKITGNPFSFAIVRVVDPQTEREITHKVADKYGRYYCLVPAGKYIVKIEKKNTDGTYSPAYTLGVIDVSRKGIIKERFKI